MINNKIRRLPFWIPAQRFCQTIKLVWTLEQQLWSIKKETENLQPRATHTSLGPSHAGRPSGSRQPRIPTGKGLREGKIKEPFTVEVHQWHIYEHQPQGWASRAMPAQPSGWAGVWGLRRCRHSSTVYPGFPLSLFNFVSEGGSLTYKALPSTGRALKSPPQMRNIFVKDSELGSPIWFSRVHVKLCGIIQLNGFFLCS